MNDLSPRQKYGYLPAVLFHVLDAAGEDVMLRLVTTCGGTRVYIGSEPAADSRLAEAVGLEAARRIYARLAAEHIKHFDVPIMSKRLEQQRHRRILAMRQESVKVADIALQLGMTERGIYMALARARDDVPDARQLSLI
ncbi:MAG: hypothetical protein HYU60_00325 [Magnetospirillum sp.]|nr:hypothetical protein [Magnetospirillum sp.]